MKDRTLVFLLDSDRICLAMKKRGFGAGKLNGYGGKPEPGESIALAALRELHEESGVEAREEHLEHVGRLDFSFASKPDGDLTVHTYLVRAWDGEPVETEEMSPEWFPLGAIPFDRMWVDDTHWLPRVLTGERLAGFFHLSEDGSEILEYELRALQ